MASRKVSWAAGAVLLAVGVALVLAAALAAYQEYKAVSPEIASAVSGAAGLEEVVRAVMGPLVVVLLKIAFLSLVIWAGGVLTARGVELLREHGE